MSEIAERSRSSARVLMVNETPIAKDERAWLEARSLVEAGYAVTVVCPKEYRAEARYRELDGVRIHAYAPPSEPTGLITHAWELAYCWLRSAALSLRVAAREGFDVIHACNPPDTFFLLAALYKPFGKRFIFAQHDLVPELWYSRYGDRGLLGTVLHRGLLGMEWLSYRLASAVIVPNESYKAVAVRRGRRDPGTVFVVRNGPDLDKVRLVEPDDSLKQGREHLVCYLGIMNPQDGVDYLLRAIAYLVHEQKRTDTQFALVGSGDILGDLKAMSEELRISEYVTFAGWVSDPDLLSRYLRTADVCVAPDPKTPLNEVSSFMKIMDYMAVERPVVAFDLAETRVSAADAALYARPDDTRDLADKISMLLDDPAMRERMGRIGRERIESGLSWKHQESRLIEAYDSVLPLGRRVAHQAQPRHVLGSGAVRPTVAIDTLEGKRQFLEFWGLPYVQGTDGDSTVSLLSADSWDARPQHAVVMLTADGAPKLHRTGDGLAFFAPVRPIDEVPAGMESVAQVMDDRGRVVSHVLYDDEAQSYYLPFSLDDSFDGFQLEHYTRGRRFPPDGLLGVYYKAKPLLPKALVTYGRRVLARVQERSTFPEWPVDFSLEELKRYVLVLLLKASRDGELPFIWFWPEGRDCCLVLTHDVEHRLRDNPGIWRIVAAEKSKGLRSSFNVVPFKYEIHEPTLDRLRAEGCEVGVHGYSHDGSLFRDKSRFAERISQVNRVGREWGAKGFRSASTFRDPDLIRALEFDYDLSFFDTDPYEPQPGGCLSLFPYFIGDLVEIPMTLPQDYTLFVMQRQKDARVWLQKLNSIRTLNGLACLNAHPDEGYVGDAEKVKHYLEFLEHVEGDDGVWNPLPTELAQWWRARREARVVPNGKGCTVESDASGMVVSWARLGENGLVLESATGGQAT